MRRLFPLFALSFTTSALASEPCEFTGSPATYVRCVADLAWDAYEAATTPTWDSDWIGAGPRITGTEFVARRADGDRGATLCAEAGLEAHHVCTVPEFTAKYWHNPQWPGYSWLAGADYAGLEERVTTGAIHSDGYGQICSPGHQVAAADVGKLICWPLEEDYPVACCRD